MTLSAPGCAIRRGVRPTSRVRFRPDSAAESRRPRGGCHGRARSSNDKPGGGSEPVSRSVTGGNGGSITRSDRGSSRGSGSGSGSVARSTQTRPVRSSVASWRPARPVQALGPVQIDRELLRPLRPHPLQRGDGLREPLRRVARLRLDMLGVEARDRPEHVHEIRVAHAVEFVVAHLSGLPAHACDDDG